MWSSRPVCARPVRTFARSAFRVSIDFAIFCSAVFFTSLIMIASSRSFPSPARRLRVSPPLAASAERTGVRGKSTMHERSFVFAEHAALQRPGHEDREYLEQHVLVAAQRERRRVHHL